MDYCNERMIFLVCGDDDDAQNGTLSVGCVIPPSFTSEANSSLSPLSVVVALTNQAVIFGRKVAAVLSRDVPDAFHLRAGLLPRLPPKAAISSDGRRAVDL